MGNPFRLLEAARDLGVPVLAPSHDPRIRIGEPTSDEVRRATVIVDQYAIIDWTADTLRNLTNRVAPGGHGTASAHDGDRCLAVATSTRALGRVRRAARNTAR